MSATDCNGRKWRPNPPIPPGANSNKVRCLKCGREFRLCDGHECVCVWYRNWITGMCVTECGRAMYWAGDESKCSRCGRKVEVK